VFRRHRPLFADAFTLPARHDIDARLILGAIVFGAGWGLVGLCPGPAVAVLAVDGWGAVAFAVAMLAGMAAYHLWSSDRRPRGKTLRRGANRFARLTHSRRCARRAPIYFPSTS
jgi:uncharacterized membrane protein YedE/YeeE